jgi:hypothetical protein
LLNKHINVNSLGKTALFYACQGAAKHIHETVSFLLVEGGANPETSGRSEDGQFWDADFYYSNTQSDGQFCNRQEIERKISRPLKKARQQRNN